MDKILDLGEMKMAKSDCGLPARSGSTVQLISEEERQLRYNLAFGRISRSTFYKKMRELKERGRISKKR